MRRVTIGVLGALLLAFSADPSSAITGQQILTNAMVEAETEVRMEGPALYDVINHPAFAACGNTTYSARYLEFYCDYGTCVSDDVEGNSFALGYLQTVAQHHQAISTNGKALGWKGSDYLACGSTRTDVAGGQCAVVGCVGWGLSIATYGTTVKLAEYGSKFDCMDCLSPGDFIMKPSSDGVFGHVMIFDHWFDEDRTMYVVVEMCDSQGKALLNIRPVSDFAPDDGYYYYRHPEYEFPWALLASSRYENGQVVFETVQEKDCDAFRVLGSEDGTNWIMVSPIVSAIGGGTEYRVTPTMAFRYYRIQSRDLREREPRWLDHDEVLTTPAKPATPVVPAWSDAPTRVVVNMSGDPNHPGFLDYLERSPFPGDKEEIVFSLNSMATDDFVNQQRAAKKLVKLWWPERDHVWLRAAEDRVKKTGTSVPPLVSARKALLIAPQSLNLPLEYWQAELEYDGWQVWQYEYSGTNWTSIISTVNNLVAANGITHITAFGLTRENNSSGTSVPGTYIADADSSIGWWTNNILTYEGLRSGKIFGIELCQDSNDFWAAYDRLLTDQYAWSQYSWTRRSGWVEDENANGVSGQVAWEVFRAIDDSLQIPATGQWWQWSRNNLRDSQITFGCDNRAIAAEDNLNYFAPALVMMYGTVSRPDGPGKWLTYTCPQWLYDPNNLWTTGVYATFLGLTCGSTGHDIVSQTSVASSMSRLYGRGAGRYVGPSRSIGQGYARYYLEMWQRLWRQNYQPAWTGDPYPTIGEIHQACVDSLKANFEGDVVPIANSIIMLGFPTARIPGYGYDVPTAVEGSATTARAFDLKVAPNPFNPVATIRYTLDTPGATQLTVYNTSGQLVATIVDEYQGAGPHQTTWSANDLSSGIYFCHLTANGRSQTQRMVLLR